MIEYRNLRVAILGAGSVGAQVVSLLLQHGNELAQRSGAGLELVGVAVRDIDAPRDSDIPKHLLTTDAEALIVGADIVGVAPAYDHAEMTGVAASHVAYDLVSLIADKRAKDKAATA